MLWRGLDKFRPPLSDQDACISGRQVERITDVYPGQVHSVDTFREVANEAHAKARTAVPHATDSMFIDAVSYPDTQARAGEQRFCEEFLPRVAAGNNEESSIR